MDERKAASSGKSAHGNLFLRFVSGLVIGIGGILPGVSGGVMAVSFGIYRPMIDALAYFFRDVRKNFLFLLPIGMGSGAGLLLGAMGLNSVMNACYTQVMYLFLGLVAGGIPSFMREANAEGFKPRYLSATFIGALIASALLLLERDSASAADVGELKLWEAALSGAIISVGVMIPGISTSFVLMYLGWYRPAMAAIANVDIPVLLCLGLGAAGFALLTLRAASWFYRRFHGYAYYGTLGFLIVSACLIFPGFTFTWGQVVSILLMIGGFFAAMFLEKIGKSP